jgi:hypothetical protein
MMTPFCFLLLACYLMLARVSRDNDLVITHERNDMECIVVQCGVVQCSEVS